MNNSSVQKVISVADMDKLSPAELQAYLGLTPKQYAEMDDDTQKDADGGQGGGSRRIFQGQGRRASTRLHGAICCDRTNGPAIRKPNTSGSRRRPFRNTTSCRCLIGSLKATIVALLFSVPLALGAAIYVSQLATPRIRELLKPAIELLAGIPSVVLGFFALIVMATVLQKIFGYQSRLNAFVAGIALGLAIIPVVFSIAEDALTSVPRSYTQAALALGSSRWQAAWKIVLPAAIPGVFAAVVLGFGRAIGETMIVLMASGNASIVSWNIFDSARTMTATIAAELAEAVFGGQHYRILFMLGVLLFVVTFVSNMVGGTGHQPLETQTGGQTMTSRNLSTRPFRDRAI